MHWESREGEERYLSLLHPPCLAWFGSGCVLLLLLSDDLLLKPQLSSVSVQALCPSQAQGGNHSRYYWSLGTSSSFTGSLKSAHSFVSIRYPFDVPPALHQNPDLQPWTCDVDMPRMSSSADLQTISRSLDLVSCSWEGLVCAGFVGSSIL